MNVVELFPCSGGMAEGARRAGIEITMSFDWSADACASYEANHGHRPVQVDVADLLRMVVAGWRPPPIDLLIADPPCTPWSRAGNRLGTDDERDMLEPTVDLVRLLRPRAYLIANVPGLDDSPNWPVVQRTIGGLAADGYCVVDFARLDAADFGVPQHRVRPFWFGHLDGPCVVWPSRTHGAVAECLATLPGIDGLRPYVTCRQALQHLSAQELGKPINLRWRGCSTAQHGSVADKPARTVGTSNLSDGNVLVAGASQARRRKPGTKPRASHIDTPAGVVTANEYGDGNVLFAGPNHRPSRADAPARTLTRNTHSDGAILASADMFPPSNADEPSRTVRADARGQQIMVVPHHPISPDADGLSRTIRASSGGTPDKIMAWPWDAPSTTVSTTDRIPPRGHHPESVSILSQPGAIKLSEKAAAILQGFAESWKFVGRTKEARWDQIGMAMPPGLAEPVFRAIARRGSG